MTESARVERWDAFELVLKGPADGNPYKDVTVGARFSHRDKTLSVSGFYDGDGVYRVRFMPELEGDWHYQTESNAAELDKQSGELVCVPNLPPNRGPVRVSDKHHFAYADGSPHASIGTTCYAWAHQSEELIARTLQTLQTAPFNKLRMMLFPKNYDYNRNEPVHHAFEDGPPVRSRMERLNPAYFRNIELRIRELCALGIEADLILFTAYDWGRWGYDTMPAEVEDLIFRHLIARVAAYRNVWWSLANEWDLLKNKTLEDWQRHFRVIAENDPYGHLCSIHNCGPFYDHNHPSITHVSVQAPRPNEAAKYRTEYGKPVVYDECQYEGDIAHFWGNISAQELVHRFWMGACAGGYVGHGETYHAEDEVLWWGKGGVLKGGSPARIAFLRKVLADLPGPLDPLDLGWNNFLVAGRAPDYYLHYFGPHQPRTRELDLPEGHAYRAEVLDTWEMTVTELPGPLRGKQAVSIPPKPYQALRVRRIE
jgi:hypothetical protein